MTAPSPTQLPQLAERFDALRVSLRPVLDAWRPVLEDIHQQLRGVSDKNVRLACIIEYNTFSSFCQLMQTLHASSSGQLHEDPAQLRLLTSAEIKRNADTLHRMYAKIERAPLWDAENVGRDLIEAVIQPLEVDMCNSSKLAAFSSLFARLMCRRRIKTAIELLKEGRGLMPDPVRSDIERRINALITALNTRHRWGNFGRGVLLQLGKEPERTKGGMVFMYDVAVIHPLRCTKCNATEELHSNKYKDVYAPLHCKNCRARGTLVVNDNYRPFASTRG